LLVSAIRPSSGHLYIILKTAHMLGILIAVRLGPHETFTSVKNLLQTSVKFPEIYDDMIWWYDDMICYDMIRWYEIIWYKMI